MIWSSSFEKIIYRVKFCTELWALLKNGVKVTNAKNRKPAGKMADDYDMEQYRKDRRLDTEQYKKLNFLQGAVEGMKSLLFFKR